VKRALEQKCPGVRITGDATKDASGAFELTEKLADGSTKTYWSKLHGQGHLAGNDSGLDEVAAAINAAA
jgi:hypothetical protein